jgi:hypothetical protein
LRSTSVDLTALWFSRSSAAKAIGVEELVPPIAVVDHLDFISESFRDEGHLSGLESYSSDFKVALALVELFSVLIQSNRKVAAATTATKRFAKAWC